VFFNVSKNEKKRKQRIKREGYDEIKSGKHRRVVFLGF